MPILTFSWRIGKIFGVPTDLHWTFLLVPPAILYFAYAPARGGINWNQAGWWGLVALLLFGFILVHELGHALAARNRGVTAERIVLFPLGGGAYIPEKPARLWAEVLVYAAGPLANVLLAGVAYYLLLQHPEGRLLVAYYLQLASNLVVVPGLWERLLGLTLTVNLLLAAGNLLPAYPLDGGRILRALLRGPLGARGATIVVTGLGVAIGGGLAYLSFRLGDPLLGSGAVFVVGMSVLEYRNGWQRRRLAAYPVEKVARPVGELKEERLYPTTPIGTARRLFDRSGWPVLPVHNRWNQPLGFVERELTFTTELASDRPLLALTEAEYCTCAPAENLLEVTERIVAADVYGAILYGPRRRVIGYVFTEDIMVLLGK